MRVVSESWRGLTQPDDADFFRRFDAVIVPTVMGRRRTYEVYSFGQIIAKRDSLATAKQVLEEVYGQLNWRSIQLDPLTVQHYWFGQTEEFQDPTNIWVVDHLPSLI